MRSACLCLVVLFGGCGWFSSPEVKVPEPGDGAVFGLRLGVTTGPEAEAWAKQRGLTCTTSASARRETTQLRCAGAPPEAFPERDPHGPISDLIVAWPDGRPVHFVSMWRRYSVPGDALKDYTQAVAAVTGALGPATLPGETPTEADLQARLVRYNAAWKRPDLEVSVGVLRAGADFLSISEQWRVPGVEAQVAVRASHGYSGATSKSDEAPAKPAAP